MENPEPVKIGEANVTSATITPPVTIALNQAIGICALALGVCFFFPWVTIFGFNASGFYYAKQGGKALLLWALPLFCLITVIGSVTKSNLKHGAQLTGAIPFAIAGYGFYHEQQIWKIFAVGAWLGLILGLVIFFLGRRVK